MAFSGNGPGEGWMEVKKGSVGDKMAICERNDLVDTDMSER